MSDFTIYSEGHPEGMVIGPGLVYTYPDVDENSCKACGYVESEYGSLSDNAHDNLCCGTEVCSDPSFCEIHDARDSLPTLSQARLSE